MLFGVIPLLATTTDATANVAVVEGVNDNVSQNRDANGQLDRHPAAFTGVDLGAGLRFTNRDSDLQTLQVRARAQAYVGLDQPGSLPPTGTLVGGYAGSFITGKRSSLTLTAGVSLTAISSARTGDGNLLLTVDPTAQSTSVGSYSGYATYSYQLTPKWTLSETAGVLVTNTLSAPPLQAANGIVLDRQGLDGVLPSSTTVLSRELGKRDTGTLSLTYRYTYSPYSLDLVSDPPRIGGPESIHQVVPAVGLIHAFSQTLTSTTTAGVSFATPQRFQEGAGIQIFPVGSEQLAYTTPRWTARALVSVTYGSVSPRLGAGPTYTAVGTLAGSPILGRKGRSIYLIATLQASESTVPTTGDDTAKLGVAGAGAELRWGLSQWLGLYTGYDARISSSVTANDSPFFRQIFFIGVSGYFTTDGALPPIETVQSPYTPG